MMKRLISLACCLLPMGAGASVVVNPDNVANTFVSTESEAWLNAGSQSIVINASQEYPVINSIKSVNGFSVANNVYYGMPTQGSESGDLYILSNVVDPFTIESQGDVSIGAILTVLGGKNLTFKSNDSAVVPFDLTIGNNDVNQGIFVGQDGVEASLTAKDIDAFTVKGAVKVYGDLTVAANSVAVSGGIDANAGNVQFDVAGNVAFDGMTVTGTGTTNLNAGGAVVSNATVQNNAGDMEIVAGGDVTVDGALANNTASTLSVTGADLLITDVMTNSVTGGKILLDVDSWTVSGGTETSFSVVNKGDFSATVAGETSLANGISLSEMEADNVFSLDTGTLVIGANSFGTFSNFLDSFSLRVRNGNIDTGAVQNGVNSEGAVNSGANMSLVALNVVVDSLVNSGNKLSVVAGATGAPAGSGNVTVHDIIVGNAGSDTAVSAQGALTVAAGVTNQSKMVLNGTTVSLADVINSGDSADLTISSLTAPTGKIVISGALTNTDGDTTVWAKDVSVAGAVTNNSGTLTIRGSDTNGGAVQIGSINAAGGVIDFNALAGAASVSNGVLVSKGALNLGEQLNVLGVVGTVQVDGDVTASGLPTAVMGNMNIAAAGNAFVLSANTVDIAGDIDVTSADVIRNVQFDSIVANVGGNVKVANKGVLTLGKNTMSNVEIAGDLTVNNGGVFETYSNEVVAASVSGNGLFKMHGKTLSATVGNVDVDGNLYFDPSNDPISIATGLLVRDTNEFSISATDINVGAVSVGSVNSLGLKATDAVTIGGTLVNNGVVNIDAVGAVSIAGAVNNKDAMLVSGATLTFADVTNSSVFTATATDRNVTFADIVTSGDRFDVTTDTTIYADSITQNAGVMNLDAHKLLTQSISVAGTVTQANLNVSNVVVDGNVSVSGDFVQGDSTGMLNHYADTFTADNLQVGGDFLVNGMQTTYSIGTALRVDGDMVVSEYGAAVVNAGSSVTMAGLTNSGDLTLGASYALNLGNLSNDSGTLSLSAATINMDTFAIEAGNVVLAGQNLNVDTALNTTGVLYQGYRGRLDSQDINIVANSYVINTSNLNVTSINQTGKLLVNSSDIDVGGSIKATDLRFVAVPVDNWMNVNIAGSVLGNVDFIGLEKMTVSGDYLFDYNSNINAVVLPYAAGSTIDSTDVNYWSRVGLTSDGLVQIENAADGAAMINVSGTFTAGQNALNLVENADAASLAGGQIGLDLRDVVDQGTAIWFVHANGGIKDAGALDKVRNLMVRYCNADGTLCYDYMDSLDVNNATGDEAPAYVAARDNDIYIVFDPRFGGPIEVFKLQPIVIEYPLYTNGEYVAAGALDNLIAGRLKAKKFFNRTPIEVIPLVFQGTNMQEMATELYNRMEYYTEMNRDSGAIANFARLFQPREIEQIAGSIVLNEHTAFRSFEDRMFDEFIWNRNRSLKKAWLDVDYGMLFQNIQDHKHTDGNRFAIAGGFDWQESNTLQLGLTGRVARTTSKSSDKMDLSYIPGQAIDGRVDIDVADTNIAFGAYLMKTVSEKVRLYGNAFVDMHILDVARTQNYVNGIDGDGSAFSLISEWGIMHDILNQYIVGNFYVRAGYNMGFELKEKVNGHEYMRLQSDGYAMLTPGYSLTAQKRIYPSAWFQMRPYLSAGVEYDLFGAPERAEYKFAYAENYTKYDVEVEPLWLNIGGGIELLSANGLQFGLDYRYQYNADVQLHNIRVSGSYRF